MLSRSGDSRSPRRDFAQWQGCSSDIFAQARATRLGETIRKSSMFFTCKLAQSHPPLKSTHQQSQTPIQQIIMELNHSQTQSTSKWAKELASLTYSWVKVLSEDNLGEGSRIPQLNLEEFIIKSHRKHEHWIILWMEAKFRVELWIQNWSCKENLPRRWEAKSEGSRRIGSDHFFKIWVWKNWNCEMAPQGWEWKKVWVAEKNWKNEKEKFVSVFGREQKEGYYNN